MSEKKIPKIRFPEFTGDWEQRKLGEFVDITTGKLDANAMKEDGEYDFYTSGIQKYKIDVAAFEGPAITIAGNGATVGYMHMADGMFNAYQRTYVLSEFKADRQFLFFEIGNRLPTKIRQEARTGNIPYIVMDMLTDLVIAVPQSEEQEKIGAFMMQLDNLITLHQRKCDKIKEYQKGCLQKMFPKEGEAVPEVRFPEFTGDWEQRKLSELVDYSNGTGHEEHVLPEGKYELITLKSINSEGDLVSSDKYVNEKFETLKQGTLIMMLSEQAKGMLGMTTVIPCDNRYVLNQRVAALTLKDSISPSFLTKAINNKQNYFEQMGAGTKVQNISRGHVENCLIEIPKYDEQQQIGVFFDNLDNLITLHQRECEKYKKLKKGLLQQMFV